MTAADIYKDFINQLKTIYEDREAENISDWVFENVTGLKKWARSESQSKELNEIHFEKLKKYLKELLEHKPVQQVLNEAWFYKRKFYVNENVLIPRPETEELVEWIIKDTKMETSSNLIPDTSNLIPDTSNLIPDTSNLIPDTSNLIPDTSNLIPDIIDIGTGSGCIPISLKKELPNTKVTAIEVSEKALTVAKRNAKDLDAAIDFFQIDFLNEVEWQMLSQYDLVVSNPPYIPVHEKQILAKNVTDFEPEIALFVDNNDPFIFYKKIAKFALLHLTKNGKIYLEVHEEYAKEVKIIFEKESFVSEIKKDIYGKERMVKTFKKTD